MNHPLNVDGVKVYLIGHGYAPVFKVTDGTGKVVYDQPVPFIAVNTSGLTSEGVVKVPDAKPDQLGFAGVFLPTAVDAGGALESVFPAPLNPRVSLISYPGNLGMNSGPSQSVYSLNTAGLTELPVAPRPLAPGQSIKLPGGAGTLTFTGYRQWASLAITYDPGQLPALIAGLAALAGLLLSFFIRRRRMFVRAYPGPGGRTVVDVGGLARSDPAAASTSEFSRLAEEFRVADARRDQRGETRPMAVNQGLSHLSDHFLMITLVPYFLAVLAFAADFAFGKRLGPAPRREPPCRNWSPPVRPVPGRRAPRPGAGRPAAADRAVRRASGGTGRPAAAPPAERCATPASGPGPGSG